jgi:hypothetical protein
MRTTILAATMIIVSGTLLLSWVVTSLGPGLAGAERARVTIDIVAITRGARDLPAQQYDAF